MYPPHLERALRSPPPGLPLFTPKTTTFTCISSKHELGAGGPEMKKVWGSCSQNTHNLIGKIRHEKRYPRTSVQLSAELGVMVRPLSVFKGCWLRQQQALTSLPACGLEAPKCTEELAWCSAKCPEMSAAVIIIVSLIKLKSS